MPGFIFTYGRFNPPTIGHGILFREIVRRAEETGATPVFVVSHKNTTSKNPLTAEEKVSIIKKVFPDVDVRASGPGKLIGAVTGELIEEYGNPGVMLLGSNRIKAGDMAFLNNIHGITRNQAGVNRRETAVEAQNNTSASGSKTRRMAAGLEEYKNTPIDKRRELFKSQFINQTMDSDKIAQTMNLIQRRMDELPAKTPPKKKKSAKSR